MRSRSVGPRLFAAALPGLVACATSTLPIGPAASGLESPLTILRIYHGTQVAELHSVRWTPDSISGVPYFQAVACDSCRVGIGRTTVDSVKQIRGRETAGFVIAAIPVVFLALVAAAANGVGD